jgi:hypothetical protein
VTTSPVTSSRPPKSTSRVRKRPRGGSCARQLVEVLYSCRIWSAHGGIWTHQMSVYSLKDVASTLAFPYNRDQMRGQTSFETYPIFCWRKAQIVQRLVRLVVADQHFTKSVHRLARAYMLFQPVRSGGKHLATSIPRNPTIVRVTHHVSTCAGLQCRCSASGFIALCRIINTSTRKSFVERRDTVRSSYRRHLAYPSFSLRHRIMITEDQEKRPITLSMSCMKT